MNYFQEYRFPLDKITFGYLGGFYEGRGTMTWNPKDGFHIEAAAERRGDLPQTILIKRIDIATPTNHIRMKIRHLGVAVVPNVVLQDRFDLIHQKWLTLDIKRVVFLLVSKAPGSDKYCGEALYDTGGRIGLPDSVSREVRLGDEKVELHYSMSGVQYCDDRLKVTGRMTDDTHLIVSWSLGNCDWKRRDNWKWAESFREAISITTGTMVRMLKRHIIQGRQERVEFNCPGPVRHLGVLAPLGIPDFFNKQTLIGLTEFFTRFHGTERAEVCQKMLAQIETASTLQSQQARELIISTTLEAMLRTLYTIPFEPGAALDIFPLLDRFRDKYLSTDWIDTCAEVKEVYKRLRHRNAHPDWVVGYGGSLSPEMRSQSIDDLVFLCRFYGYMIRAIAGFENLKPEFPPPHAQWSPLLTISTS